MTKNDYVLRTVEERGIGFIQLWFTDVLGTPKAFHITPQELENALEEGMTFDGSAIDGFSRTQEADVLARPDPSTFQVLPYEGNGAEIARVVCDISNLDGSAFEGCPRHTLRRVAERARDQGYTFYVAPEIEYFYFASNDPTSTPQPLDSGGYFDLSVGDQASALRRRSVKMLEEMGIPVEHAQHEDAPSQHEVDLRYTDVLTMADTVMTTRLVLKALASAEAIVASFMPKPLASVQGSGMHTHCSLWANELNAFADPDDEAGLSVTARQFMAGLLVHAPEITAITNQWVNSYKRLVPGHEAPVNIGWARSNRSALVRVPVVKHGRVESTRLEYRAPDSACNPYLSFAVMLAAGLKGIEGAYDLEPELAAASHDGARPLPSNLNDAVDLLEGSTLARETLGDHVVEWFVRNKRAEWAAYKSEITQFELDRYLPTL